MKVRWIGALLAAACGGGGGVPEAEPHAAPIIGGTVDTGDPAVVGVFVGGGCSGTVVAPRVVLTAAHCVQDAVDGGWDSNGFVVFGVDVYQPDAIIDVVRAVYHRQYGSMVVGTYDVAMVLLESDAPVAPDPMNHEDLEGVLGSGARVHSVGYGQDEGGTFGVKRSGEVLVQSVHARHLFLGEPGLTICYGDSGGPDYFEIDGERRIVGIHSYGWSCGGDAVSMRTDAFWDRFFLPILSAWDGPCKLDGACVTGGCTLPDPDCDPCSFDGTCREGCDLPDLDCPLGGLAGASCVVDTDCESRVCVAAPDEPRIHYCSETCDPSDDGSCGATMECIDDGARSVCAFPTPTPGAQGYGCRDGEQCRSGLCDPGQGICVEPCDASTPVCSEGYTCQASALDKHVCRLPEEERAFSSICGVARGGGSGLAWIIAAAAIATRWAKRRRA